MKHLILAVGIIGILSGCTMRPKSFEGVAHAKPQIIASLVGQSKTDIYDRFWQPIISRTEHSNTLWSYQSDSCALLVYFDEKGVCRHAETRGKCQ